MLIKKNRSILNDGKVVMVKLVVIDKHTGEVFEKVGRATCDLDHDVFDLQVGISIAEQRAFKKAVKSAKKTYKKLIDMTVSRYQEYMNCLSKLDSMLKDDDDDFKFASEIEK